MPPKVKFSSIANITIGSGFILGWWYRPKADEIKDNKGPLRGDFMSKYGLAETADQPRPLLYQLASHIVLLATTAVARTFLFSLGDCTIKKDEHYENFLQRVLEKGNGSPMITVSNHRSLVDDPAVMSGILPLWMAVQPKYNRYAVCSQEFCFAEKVSYLVTSDICRFAFSNNAQS